MPSVPFGTSSYARGRGDLPALPVINGWIEAVPSEQKGFVFQSRPGLADHGVTMGSGPVRALFKGDNVLGSGLFGISGVTLYAGSEAIGTINGTGPVSMAGYSDFLFVAAGAGLWGYDGSALSQVAFPDGADVSKVVTGQSRLIAIRADTGTFYWSDPLGETIDGLAFATAEASPDRALDLAFVDGILIIFGAETVEFWPATGDADLPFSPLQARVIERGIRATGCATVYGSTFAWVTNRNQVCLTDENTVISNPGLEERIAASTECSLFRFFVYGMEFIGLRLDGEFQAFRDGRWSEFKSYGEDNFLPQCWAGDVFGSAVDGKTLEWGSDWQDLGGVMERRVRFGMPINSGGVSIDNIQVRGNTGQSDSEPRLELRLSRDAGRTWGNWKAKSLGREGAYRKPVRWNGLGMASYPALLGELRITDPVDWRLSDVLVNEGHGGR